MNYTTDSIGTRVVRLGVPSDHCTGRAGDIVGVDKQKQRCRVRWDTSRDGTAIPNPIRTWVKFADLEPAAAQNKWDSEKKMHSGLVGCFISFTAHRITTGNPVTGWLRNLHADGKGFEIELAKGVVGLAVWQAGDVRTFRTELCSGFKRLVH